MEKGDTDTDAAIAGALIGAKQGYQNRGDQCKEVQCYL